MEAPAPVAEPGTVVYHRPPLLVVFLLALVVLSPPLIALTVQALPPPEAVVHTRVLATPPPLLPRVFVAVALEDGSDAIATRARLALQGHAKVSGYVLATVPRTARGLHLVPPLGNTLPPGCWDASASGAPLCVAAELPPLPHGLHLGTTAARVWQRGALLEWLAAWLARGGAPWAPLPHDVVLLTRGAMLQHPDALAQLRLPVGGLDSYRHRGGKRVDPVSRRVPPPLPARLQVGPHFVYHLGWAAAQGQGGAEEDCSGGGEAWRAAELPKAAAAAAAAATTAAAAARNHFNGTSPGDGASSAGGLCGRFFPFNTTPGSALLGLFGGVRAVAGARARAGPEPPLAQWSSVFSAEDAVQSYLAGAAGARWSAAESLVWNGVDARSGFSLKRVGAASAPASEELDFARLLERTLRGHAGYGALLPCFLEGKGCEGDAAPQPRLYFACVEGRLGNYFHNLINAIGLAAAAGGRVPVLPAYTTQGADDGLGHASIAKQFQYTGAPWLPAPKDWGGLAKLLRSSSAAHGSPQDASRLTPALCFASHSVGLRGCGGLEGMVPWLATLGGVTCSETITVGDSARPPHPISDPPFMHVVRLHATKLVNVDSHPVGILGAHLPPPLTKSPLPVVQDFNFYGYSFADDAEYLRARCSVDFAQPILDAAWEFAGPQGPLRGEPFFAVHIRLEDFSSAFPGEDISPPLEAFARYAVRLAEKAGLKRAFLATNGRDDERLAALGYMSSGGLEAFTHPGSANPGPKGALVDAAILGYGAGFLGNMQSTYSWMVAQMLACRDGARSDTVHFFEAAAAREAELEAAAARAAERVALLAATSANTTDSRYVGGAEAAANSIGSSERSAGAAEAEAAPAAIASTEAIMASLKVKKLPLRADRTQIVPPVESRHKLPLPAPRIRKKKRGKH